MPEDKGWMSEALKEAAGRVDELPVWAGGTGKALQERDQLRAEVGRLKGADLCDACAGLGQPISGKPCVCGGSGSNVDEKTGLRRLLYDANLQLAAVDQKLTEAVNEECSCGGGEPGHCCVACAVYHRFKGTV